MPHVATMGCSSCATISIGGFKSGDTKGINEKYKADGTVPETSGKSVKEFYNKVLYPTSQPLGKSRDLPFTKLMEDIRDSYLNTKMCMAVLNEYQYQGDDKYWHTELKKWGFRLKTKCKNDIGSINDVYWRNPNHVKIEVGER